MAPGDDSEAPVSALGEWGHYFGEKNLDVIGPEADSQYGTARGLLWHHVRLSARRQVSGQSGTGWEPARRDAERAQDSSRGRDVPLLPRAVTHPPAPGGGESRAGTGGKGGDGELPGVELRGQGMAISFYVPTPWAPLFK